MADIGADEGPSTLALIPKIDPAPAILMKEEVGGTSLIDPSVKELKFNPKYEELYRHDVGPTNPFKSEAQKAPKNTLTGYVEDAHFNEFQFKNQYQTFNTFGYAIDPTADAQRKTQQKQEGSYVGNVSEAVESKGTTIMENIKTGSEKRKRVRNWDAGDVEGYLGPWGGYVDEEKVSKPDAETLKQMEEFKKKKKKFKKFNKQTAEDEEHQERSTLHIKDTTDYRGRTFMQPPVDLGNSVREDYVPNKCYVPKKQIAVYQGHTKGVQAIKWFPKYAHMFLSCSMDTKIKLWDVYRKHQCVRTYAGHRMAVRDVNFNNDGSEFLSISFDRYIKLWDTETGEVKQRFTSNKMGFVVKFNPDPDKQHLFLSGMQDKKILQWDTRSGEIVQEYDRHLGPVNTITFIDKNKRFVTTSDDKTLRIWEWDIPVDTKMISDPSLHSLAYMSSSPNGRWIAGQAMDNRVILFQMMDEKLKFSKKKSLRGHMVAGYACGVDFAPDMSFVMSGDANGRVYIWDWKTHKISASWKAHDNVCIDSLWHPHETSTVLTCGWDNFIKLWA